MHVQTSPDAVEDLIKLFAELIKEKNVTAPAGGNVNGSADPKLATYSYQSK